MSFVQDMGVVADYAVAALILIGAFFALVGSYGLVKLPDLMTRLHAPTKASTLGAGGVLLGSVVHFSWNSDSVSTHELLVSVFLFLTAPLTAQMIAKAWLHRHARPQDLPPTGTDHGWATYDPPPPDPEDRVAPPMGAP
jgi:multicomponent K+:H+ antiporter subunit G